MSPPTSILSIAPFSIGFYSLSPTTNCPPSTNFINKEYKKNCRLKLGDCKASCEHFIYKGFFLSVKSNILIKKKKEVPRSTLEHFIYIRVMEMNAKEHYNPNK